MTFFFILTDGHEEMKLNRSECRNMELKLNVSSHGTDWSYIGDNLFAFSLEEQEDDMVIAITTAQYEFFVLLQKRDSWNSCKDL